MEKLKALKAKHEALGKALSALMESSEALEAKVGASDTAGFDKIVKECASLDAAASAAKLSTDANQQAAAPTLDRAAQAMLPKALCAKHLKGVEAVADMIAVHLDQATELAETHAEVTENHLPVHDMSADDAVAALSA
jgi:hypothetical protein